MTNGLNMVELCVLLMDAGCQLVYCMILICNDLRIGFYFPKVRRRRQWQYHTVINWYNASLFRVVALSSFVFLIHLLVIQSPKIVHKWDRPKYIAVQIQWKRNDSFIRCCCCRWTIGWVNKLFDRHRFCAKRSFLHIRNKLKLMMKRRRSWKSFRNTIEWQNGRTRLIFWRLSALERCIRWNKERRPNGHFSLSLQITYSMTNMKSEESFVA